MVTYRATELPLADLLLDPNNFRFKDPKKTIKVAEDRFGEDGVQSAAIRNIQDDGVDELKSSIIKNGFVPIERIIVRSLGTPVPSTADADDGDESADATAKYVVVEGNRRTTALKQLQQENTQGAPLEISLVEIFAGVPVLVVEDATDEDLLAIMGIRHVGGPKEWGGYQSALLVYQLRAESGYDARETAARLGLATQEVNRRYKSFCALKQMMDNDEFGNFVTPELYPVFQEAFSLAAVKKWLGWSEATLNFTNAEELEYFYSWVSQPVGTPKISGYSAVRHLRKIIDAPEALAALKEDGSVEEALAIADSEAKARRWRPNAQAALKSLKDMTSDVMRELEATDLEVLRDIRSQAKFILDAHATAAKSAQDDDE